MIFILLYIYENTDFESLYIGYYTSELHFLPVKSENKKLAKKWMKISSCGMIRKSIRRGFYAKRVGKIRKTIGGGN